MIRLWLVVPCYNEQGRLRIDEFERFTAEHDHAGVLFVNDGSTDSTGDLIDSASAGNPGRIHALHLDRNSGKGEAVRHGMLAAPESATVVGFWDADLATPLPEVAALEAVLDQHPEVDWVFGSRVMLLGRNIERRPLRHYLGRVFATFASMALKMPVYDTQCGAKLFRFNRRLRTILDTPFRSRWIFDVEMLARLAAAAGGVGRAIPMIYEVPLTAWRDVTGSKVSIGAFIRSSTELLGIARQVRDIVEAEQP